VQILSVALVTVLALVSVSCSSASAEDLTEEEIAALISVGDDFENGDQIWLEYLGTDDGTKACQTAYESANS
jgi:hypothetical protein